MASTAPPTYQALLTEDPSPQLQRQQQPTGPPATVAVQAQAGQTFQGAVTAPVPQPPVAIQQAPIQQVPVQQMPGVPVQQIAMPVQQFVPTQQQWGAGYPQQAPVQYIAAPQAVGQGYPYPGTVVVQPATYEGPHDFLVLSLVVTIICGILNLLSLAFGIPAIILSVLSMNSKGNKNYPQAKTFAKYAIFMTVCNIMFTLLMALLITGLVVGCTSGGYYYSYYYSYYGC